MGLRRQLAGGVGCPLRVMLNETGSEDFSPKHQQGTAMEYYAGIDVSLEHSSVCVVDASGKIVREAKVTSEPDGPG
jgi:hypothetical protein